jgi:hypothetical protein
MNTLTEWTVLSNMPLAEVDAVVPGTGLQNRRFEVW